MIEDAIANAGPRARDAFATMCEVAQRFAGWLDLGSGIQVGARVRLRALGRAGIPGRPRRRDPVDDAPPARGAGTSPSSSPPRAPTRHGPSSSVERAPRTTLGSPTSPCGTSDDLLAGLDEARMWEQALEMRAVPAGPDRRRTGRRRLHRHRHAHRSQVAVAARALDGRGRARRGRRLAHGPPGGLRRRSCGAPRSRTTSAASACRTRSGRSRGRSGSASGSGCGSIPTTRSAPSPSRRRSPRSGSWPARTTSGSTAPATTAARVARRSTRPPASSPPPTATGPCARRGRTGRRSTPPAAEAELLREAEEGRLDPRSRRRRARRRRPPRAAAATRAAGRPDRARAGGPPRPRARAVEPDDRRRSRHLRQDRRAPRPARLPEGRRPQPGRRDGLGLRARPRSQPDRAFARCRPGAGAHTRLDIAPSRGAETHEEER